MFLSRLSLKNPVLIFMLTAALIIFGYASVKSLGLDLLPNMDIPIVTITTIYPGADAKTIEEDVVKVIEGSVGTMNGIKHINSTAVNNVGLVVIEFEEDVNTSEATQSVRDKVAIVRDDLPDDAKDPLIEKFDLNASAMMILLLKAPAGEKLNDFTYIADKRVKEIVQTVQGVGNVEMYGGRDREIRVLLDHMKLNQLGIPPVNIVQLLKSSSIKVPAGSIFALNGSEELSVKGDGEIQDVQSFRNMPILNLQGNLIRVKDIARVEDGLQEEESASMHDLTPAIALEIIKQGSANVVELAEDVRAQVEKIKQNLPEGYELTIVGDLTVFSKVAVESALNDIFLGALCAIFIIFLFLMNKRAMFIIAVSLPTSIIGTFLFVKIMGFTLNLMTTLGLSISVGILTDDAIVIIEAIFRHIKKGKPRIKAIMDATNEVGLAVISAELALICVFGPTIILKGVVGAIFKEFGITVVAAILISMTVSFTVAPLLSSYLLKEEKNYFFFFRFMDKFLSKMEIKYSNAVGWVLNHRLITIIVAIALFYSGIMIAGLLPSTFMPDVDRGEFEVEMELSDESSIARAKVAARELVEKLSQYEWEDSVFQTIGGGSKKQKNLINTRVIMTPKKERTIGQFEAMELLRSDLKYLEEKYDATINTSKMKVNGMESYPVMFSLVGNNLDKLSIETAKLMDFMKTDPGFVDIGTSDKGNKKEVRVQFNHEKMVSLGVNVAQSAIVLRNLIAGEKIAEMEDDNGELTEVKLYLDDPYQKIDGILNISFPTASGRIVRLSDIADVAYGNSKVEITRLDRIRQIKVHASLNSGYDLGTQIEKIKSYAATNFRGDVSLVVQGDAERMQDSFADLGVALIMAIFLIYIVLASQFNSFIHPFTIMSALPFALTGAMYSLYLSNQTLSLMSFIGIIMLMGIVTKNSILLVDYTIQKIDEGMGTVEALLESSRTRLRPILMTAGGTLFGMMPVVVSQAEGAELKQSMGWAVMGGLFFSTLVTLFIVPVIFSFLEKFRKKRTVEELMEFKEMLKND